MPTKLPLIETPLDGDNDEPRCETQDLSNTRPGAAHQGLARCVSPFQVWGGCGWGWHPVPRSLEPVEEMDGFLHIARLTTIIADGVRTALGKVPTEDGGLRQLGRLLPGLAGFRRGLLKRKFPQSRQRQRARAQAQSTKPRCGSAAARAASGSRRGWLRSQTALKQTERAHCKARIAICNHSELRRAESLLLKIGPSTIAFASGPTKRSVWPPNLNRTDGGGDVNRPRAADDFAAIRARMEELRRERGGKHAPERDWKLDPSVRRAELSSILPKRSAPDQAGFANPVPCNQPDRDKPRWARRE